MKRFLLFAVAAILFAACSKDDTDTPNINPQPKNEIWYTAYAKVNPYKEDVFGANIISNEWDEATGEGVITFDGEVKAIGDYAFTICDNLISMIIPDGVTEIGDFAFYWCDNITTVTIPDSVTEIGTSTFSACAKFAEFKGKYAADGGRCLIMDNAIIAYAEASGTTYTIPDGVTSIREKAFSSCASLTSVTIPNSITSVGNAAFSSCASLVEFKGKYAADGGRCLIVDDTLVAYATGSGTTYTIPDGVTKIEDGTFGACVSLTSVTIPDSVTEIGDTAFAFCASLTSVTIGNSVAEIGEYAFSGCMSLASVTIPDSVTKIGDSTFYTCYSLNSVYCKATTPPTLGVDVFVDNAADRKIYVPASEDDSIINAYKGESGWSNYASYIFEEE